MAACRAEDERAVGTVVDSAAQVVTAAAGATAAHAVHMDLIEEELLERVR